MENTFDSYNALSTRHPRSCWNATNDGAIDEYWTNGVTTLLSVYKADSKESSTRGCSLIKPLSSTQTQNISSEMGSATLTPKDRSTGGRDGSHRSESNVAVKSIVAGSVSGIISTLFFHPFDVLRTKMQSASPVAASASSAVSSGSASAVRSGASAAHVSVSGGPVTVFVHTVRNGGIRALYTGLQPVLAAQAGYKATVFAVNNVTRKALVEWKTSERRKVGLFQRYDLTRVDVFLCGATGGAVNAALLVAPVEYVRNRQIAHHTRISTGKGLSSESLSLATRGAFDTVQRTVNKHGLPGLWRGAGVTVLRDFLGCGGFFVMYEIGRDHLAPIFGSKDCTGTVMTSGALAGWGYWAFAMPLDTLKTLVQTGKAKSAREAVASSIEREGALATARNLFHGWQMAFGRGAPAAAVTLASYTAVYDFCNRRLS